jgi:cytochrome oxidase Cu insertion factor (SCO1/SenC/PrrC family)
MSEDGLAIDNSPGPMAPAFTAIAWLVMTMLLWAFAFYNLPGATPEWLKRAQAVCFGTSESGLPDTYGWLLLALAPLSILLGLVIALKDEINSGLRVCLRPFQSRFVATLVLLTVGAEVFWITGSIRDKLGAANVSFEPQADEELPEFYPHSSNSAPDFTLLGKNGQEFSLKSFRGKTLFLTFAFAHCQTVCPVLIQNIRQALKNLPTDRTAALVVTLDPWRDTPGSLASLEATWNLGTNGHALSGDEQQVSKVLDLYNVVRTRDEKTGDVVHPPLVYVINSKGELSYTFNNPSVRWLLEAAQRVE